MIIRPLLAATIDPLVDSEVFKRLRFPLLGSPKLDGIRALASGTEGLRSRSGKEIPSFQAQTFFGHLLGIDGEMIIGKPTDINVYNTTQSHIMSRSKPALITEGKVLVPNISYHLFDRWMYEGILVMNKPFYKRLELLPSDKYLIPVKHTTLYNIDDLLLFESDMLSEGYEGIMLRDPEGYYKEGRSTFNEGLLFKLKRFSEFEAEVVGLEEQMTNLNEKVKDELGYSERSTAKANLVAAGTLGKILVKYGDHVIPISCGCMTHAERLMYWNNPSLLVGHTIVVRHFQVGLEGYMPRHARFVGFRKDGR